MYGNAQSGLTGKTMLVNDVWEHAYYQKHENWRANYSKGWWSVVNWREVARRFESSELSPNGAGKATAGLFSGRRSDSIHIPRSNETTVERPVACELVAQLGAARHR